MFDGGMLSVLDLKKQIISLKKLSTSKREQFDLLIKVCSTPRTCAYAHSLMMGYLSTKSWMRIMKIVHPQKRGHDFLLPQFNSAAR